MALEERSRFMPGFDAYRFVVAPVLAFLPSALAYGLALLFGGLLYRISPGAKEKIVRNLTLFSLGGSTRAEREATAREFIKLRCCEAMEDLTLLRGAGPLAKSVELQGLENLRESLAVGKGVMLCGAHYGSFKSALSFLGTRGFPATPLMRRPHTAGPLASPLGKAWFWAKSYALLHNMKRRNIPVQSGDPLVDITAATVAAEYLRDNEIVYINLDATVLPSFRARAMALTFLGQDALFLPGAISIAKLTGAKVHVILAYRSKDWRHQRVVISPAMPMGGTTAECFARCLSQVDAAVRRHPAHWEMWDLMPEQGTFFRGLRTG